jgi:hypothetical protein
MERKKWLQLIVSGLSLVFSLALDLYYPHVKDALCTILPTSNLADQNNYYSGDRTGSNLDRMERVK